MILSGIQSSAKKTAPRRRAASPAQSPAAAWQSPDKENSPNAGVGTPTSGVKMTPVNTRKHGSAPYVSSGLRHGHMAAMTSSPIAADSDNDETEEREKDEEDEDESGVDESAAAQAPSHATPAANESRSETPMRSGLALFATPKSTSQRTPAPRSKPFLAKQIMTMEQYIEDLNASMQTTLADTSITKEQLEFEQYRTKTEVEDLRAEIATLQAELELANKENDMEQDAPGAILPHGAGFRAVLDEASFSNDSHDISSDLIDGLKRELAVAQTNEEQMRSELRSAKDRLARVTATATSAESAANRTISALKDKNASLMDRLAAVREENDELKVSLTEAQAAQQAMAQPVQTFTTVTTASASPAPSPVAAVPSPHAHRAASPAPAAASAGIVHAAPVPARDDRRTLLVAILFCLVAILVLAAAPAQAQFGYPRPT